jgi:hypothetical protein
VKLRDELIHSEEQLALQDHACMLAAHLGTAIAACTAAQ